MDAEEIRRRVEEHTDAVGRADIDVLGGLYARDARLYDPAGSPPVTGRAAIVEHFGRWLTVPRRITAPRIIVTGPDNSRAAVSFSATPETGPVVDIIDVMAFDANLSIVEIVMFAAPGAT